MIRQISLSLIIHSPYFSLVGSGCSVHTQRPDLSFFSIIPCIPHILLWFLFCCSFLLYIGIRSVGIVILFLLYIVCIFYVLLYQLVLCHVSGVLCSSFPVWVVHIFLVCSSLYNFLYWSSWLWNYIVTCLHFEIVCVLSVSFLHEVRFWVWRIKHFYPVLSLVYFDFD